MRYIRFENLPVKSLDLSNLPALNTITGLASKRLSTMKIDNNANLERLITIGLTALPTVNTSTCPNLQCLILDYSYAVTSLNLKNNAKLRRLIVTNATGFKTTDFSGNPLLETVQFDESGVDTVDFSHNPELYSVSMTYTPVRNMILLTNPKIYSLALDGCTHLQTVDLRAQTTANAWYIDFSKEIAMSSADAYEYFSYGYSSPVQTDKCINYQSATRKIDGDKADLYGGIRVPQYLDASGLSLTSIKVNDAIKNNYSFVMARRTNNLVPPPVITVYAADKTTILCHDYNPDIETCNN